jgi:proteasome accessory factor B
MKKTDIPRGERMVRMLAYLIRNKGRKYTPGQIHGWLEQMEPVILRNVQRDLKRMAEMRESCVQCEQKAGKLYYFIEPDMRSKFTLPIERNGLLALFLLKRLQPMFAPSASTLRQLSETLEEFGSELGDELFDDLDERLGEQTRVVGQQSLLSLESDLLNAILEGLLKQKRIIITYRRDVNSEAVTYAVCPAKLILSNSELYLVCVFEPEHTSNYYFKVCRMVDVSVLEERFTFKPRERQRIENRLSKSFGLLDNVDAKVEKVVLRFPGWFETILNEKRFHPSQKFKKDRKGNTICTLEVPVGFDFISWVLARGEEVTVVRPKSLKDEIGRIGKVLVKRYR